MNSAWNDLDHISDQEDLVLLSCYLSLLYDSREEMTERLVLGLS